MFIGDCYVHGLMFGETIGMLKRGEACARRVSFALNLYW